MVVYVVLEDFVFRVKVNLMKMYIYDNFVEFNFNLRIWLE